MRERGENKRGKKGTEMEKEYGGSGMARISRKREHKERERKRED